MDSSKAIKFLNNYRYSVLLVRSYDQEIEEFRRERNFYPKCAAEYGFGNGTDSSIEQRYIEQLDRIIEKRAKARYKRIRYAGAISKAIERMEDTRESLLLTLYYKDGYTWSMVSEKIGYSVSHIKRLHKAAVEHFAEVFEYDGN